MLKISGNLKFFANTCYSLIRRNASNSGFPNPTIVMCNDSKHVLCYHPEPEHPYEFTKPIERKIENDSVLKQEYSNLYIKRFDNKPAMNPRNHWVDAIRLAKTFNEHPIIFRRANREQRIKKYLEKVNRVRPNRQSI
ncbi:hypothetical protein BpHYR1_011968 [Brachionus plicatilis]|uniref:Uncharacterized protein n=1 Tax=Brachionus plicatilis TaxID=10195 RepID=A0A3M7RZR1_BRAPC|nr:hypothetical protein BpHYR1_011968 [Brachionus plicatilis]